MSSFNDFLGTVSQDLSQVTDISTYVRSITGQGTPLVQTGPGGTGNLTAAQLAAGMTGTPTGLHPANQPLTAASTAFGFTQILGTSGGVVLLAGAAILIFMMMKKGRR